MFLSQIFPQKDRMLNFSFTVRMANKPEPYIEILAYVKVLGQVTHFLIKKSFKVLWMTFLGSKIFGKVNRKVQRKRSFFWHF